MSGLRCVAVTLLLAAAFTAHAASRPNIILITLDTTRADHLGCYGDGTARTPVLDSIAAHGALFEEAHAHVPLTLPSHAVLMSGLLPPRLGLHVNGVRLRDGVDTLATHLKSRGYSTIAVVASSILNRDYGLANGFAVYDDRMSVLRGQSGTPVERRAPEVTDAALQRLAAVRAPFFVWVHYYDPHAGDRPYDSEIASMDAAIGKLLDGLRAKRMLDDALIVVAGDHGEGLGEHGEKHHGVFLYESTLHVPMLMEWDDRIRPGLRVGSLCGLADVAPTILALTGEGSLPSTDGVSLVPLLEGRGIAPRTLYAESYHGSFTYGWAPLRATMNERWKLIEAPRPELYRWRLSEGNDRYSSEPDQARALRKELRRYPAADLEGKVSSVDAETRGRLMSLGYLSASPTAAETRLDPKDAIAIEGELRRARESIDAGDARNAIRILTAVRRRNPRNVTAVSMLGMAWLAARDEENARRCFEEEIRLRPELESGHVNLAITLEREGRAEAAMQHYAAALAIAPHCADAAANLARLLRAGNRPDDAQRVLDGAIAAGGESAEVYVQLGTVHLQRAQWDEARFAFTKALSLDPTRADACVSLGNVALKLGRTNEAIFHYRRAMRLDPGTARDLRPLVERLQARESN